MLWIQTLILPLHSCGCPRTCLAAVNSLMVALRSSFPPSSSSSCMCEVEAGPWALATSTYWPCRPLFCIVAIIDLLLFMFLLLLYPTFALAGGFEFCGNDMSQDTCATAAAPVHAFQAAYQLRPTYLTPISLQNVTFIISSTSHSSSGYCIIFLFIYFSRNLRDESDKFCLPSCLYFKPAAMRHICFSELGMACSLH